ncbi:hypothetical protein BKA69DRAFT_1084452 [Paraphysoderma sedebokerense]|nr:hypothetical protein BKA69DRAFT_1084452 [Paraphysoderma sedebokerense]
MFNPPASDAQLQQQQTLQCSLCFRTIGLWNFSSLSSPSNPPPPSPTPSLPLPSSTASLPSTAPLKPPLNPQSQHHNYCPLIQYTQFHRDFEFIKPEELTTKRIDSCISRKLNWKVVLERVIDGMGLKSEDEIGKEREKQREQKRRVQQSQDGVGGEPTDPQLNYNPYRLLRQVKNVLSNPHKIEISSTIKSLARKHQIQIQSDIQPQNQTLQSPSTIVTDTVDRNVNVEIVEIVETGEGINDDGKL